MNDENEVSNVGNRCSGGEKSSVLDKKLNDSGAVTVRILRQSVSPLSQFTPPKIVYGPSPGVGAATPNGYVTTPSTGNGDGVSASTLCRHDGSVSINTHFVRLSSGSKMSYASVSTASPAGTACIAAERARNLVLPYTSVDNETFSPGDSDSFDWRRELSPVVVKARYNRRSSFGLLKPQNGRRRGSSESPKGRNLTRSPNVRNKSQFVVSPNRASFTPALFSALSSPGLRDRPNSDDFHGSSEVLHPIYEDADFQDHCSESECKLNYQSLLLENRKLRESLRTQNSYDTQITAFRAVFDAVSYLTV